MFIILLSIAVWWIAFICWLRVHFSKKSSLCVVTWDIFAHLEASISPRTLYSVLDNGRSHYFINLLVVLEFGHYSSPLGKEAKCKKSTITSLRKWKGGGKTNEGGAPERIKVIWLSGGSIWFRGFLASRLFQTYDKLPHLLFILAPTPTLKSGLGNNSRAKQYEGMKGF